VAQLREISERVIYAAVIPVESIRTVHGSGSPMSIRLEEVLDRSSVRVQRIKDSAEHFLIRLSLVFRVVRVCRLVARELRR